MRKNIIDKRLVDWYKIIAENVIRLRGKMSQGELARRAGISRETVGAIESNKAVGVDTLLKISDALRVEPAELFSSEEKRRAFFNGIDAYLDIKIKEAFRHYGVSKKDRGKSHG